MTISEVIRPTRERFRRGPVEKIAKPIADEHGSSGHPWRAVDTLSQMLRRGSITAAMHQAGEDFRNRFRIAQFDPLRAPDIGRPVVSGGGNVQMTAAHVAACRDLVWASIRLVGGIASPGGSCLWHVVGCERSLKEWAIEQGWAGRRIHHLAASGILIAALGVLAPTEPRKPAR